MSNDSLNDRIRALTTELATLSSVDAETRALLAGLQEQLARIAELQGEASVVDRLEAMAVRFEADHPTAGRALRQAIDALAKAGI